VSRLVEITTPPRAGSAPPLSPVPAPRAVNGTLLWWHHATTAATSWVDSGSTTTAGAERSKV